MQGKSTDVFILAVSPLLVQPGTVIPDGLFLHTTAVHGGYVTIFFGDDRAAEGCVDVGDPETQSKLRFYRFGGVQEPANV